MGRGDREEGSGGEGIGRKGVWRGDRECGEGIGRKGVWRGDREEGSVERG